ncbi:hypothetical protein AAHJ69_004420 [Salmonella enterica]|nr:hypothetical protein [Salmonella enterica]EDJ5190928.1 hypothetical protein [Salmonella enterica subsp. enterica serovar Muenchen]EBD8814516.1 hypothetical protein [Salmonella enterica]ECP3574778.1 hypothetical protein [Salmonella enterica]ECZ3871050.1 hypothetical protein [Salmonella enterica]
MREFILSTTKKNGIKEAHGTVSAYEPASEGDDLAEFIDPITGKTFYADNGADLIKVIEDNEVELISRDFFIDLSEKTGVHSSTGDFVKLIDQYNKENNESIKPTGTRASQKKDGTISDDWFHLAFDLSKYSDTKKARKVIIDTIANNTDVKISFKGEEYPLYGKRAVIAWPEHKDQDKGNHFHLWVHEGTLAKIIHNGKEILVPETNIKFNEKQAEWVQQAIIRNLVKAGVIEPEAPNKLTPPMALTIDNTTKIDKETAKQAIQGQEDNLNSITDLENKKSLTIDETIDYLNRRNKKDEDDFADLVAVIREKKEKIQAQKAVQAAMEEYRDIKNRLTHANNTISELANQKEEITNLKEKFSEFAEEKYGIKIENEDDIAAFIATHNTRLEELKQGHETEVKELNDENEELNNLNTALSDFAHNKFNVSITSIEDIKKLDEAYENEVKAHKEELESLHLDLSNLEQFKDSMSSIAKEKLGIEIESIRDLEQIGKKFDSLNDKLETLNTKLSDADIENKNLNKKLETYEKLNDGLVEEKTTLEVENKTLKGNIVAKDKEIESLNKKHEKDLEQLKAELRAEFEKELKAKTEEAVKSAVKSEEEAHAKTKKTLTGITEKFQELKKSMEEKKDNDVENKNQPKKPKI